MIKSASEYFPMIRRGFSVLGDETGKAEEEEVALGWKVDITNRKEREESLRYVQLWILSCVFSHHV